MTVPVHYQDGRPVLLRWKKSQSLVRTVLGRFVWLPVPSRTVCGASSLCLINCRTISPAEQAFIRSLGLAVEGRP